ncbi:nicotinate-nucleotide--dimethylbenzimidazole phosphoribosyltransferase [Vibrio sp. NTOU-M3]|uniref:nicotinate-nucleotide--dimethylbenzimidazole phosphoribosyltransferase n=1 Tax=Vibrio sp. NTOU-M3 TaxID=3234954 RepID=UPI00349F9616
MLNQIYSEAIWARINQKTKPLGALGQLEELAHQLALIQSNVLSDVVTKINIQKPTAIVFAGDHGIADEGVSIAPSAVTQQMVQNFLAGGAAINCFCRSNKVDLKIVDCGILIPVESDNPNFVVQRLGARTNNFAKEAAMSREQLTLGLSYGREIVEKVTADGCNIVMFGEMGIGNTSSAAAILAALSRNSVDKCVGRGTGINQEQLAKKRALVSQGVARCEGADVLDILEQVGGYEIVQMVGAFLAAYEKKVPVIVDGFIVTAAAYAACFIEPACREFMIFAHQSDESGHQLMLEEMKAEPLHKLVLRLGEGTGAVLALPLVLAAAEFYSTMASFDDAGVTV